MRYCQTTAVQKKRKEPLRGGLIIFTFGATLAWRRRRGVGKRKRVEHIVSRHKYFTLSTSSSTSTSSFTFSSEPNGNNISSVRLSRTARTSSEKFSHDFVRAERRQYSCGIAKRRLRKRSEKSRSEADLYIHFRRHLGLGKKKGCGEEEEGGTQCFTRLISL